MPMNYQSSLHRRRTCLCALLLALLLLTVACTPTGSSGESTSEPASVPTGSAPLESSEPEITTLPEENPPAESAPTESLPAENTPPESSEPESSEPNAESSESPAQEVIGNAVCYVALGDSICRGYGLKDPETQRYSSLIGARTGCTVYNYGVDGQTGAELVTFLQNGKAEALSQADVVSVSIGANNLLHALSSLLLALFSNYDPTSGSAIQVDAEDLYAAVDDALASFERELPELMDLIGEQTPNALVLFQTVYNPYRSFVLFPLRLSGGMTTLSALADECVRRLNEIIRDGALQYGYTVCDVYDTFEQNANQLVNASLGRLNFDPHPNAAGHAVIAEVLLREMPTKK